MPQNRFSFPFDRLREMAGDILGLAAQGGASACETEVSEGVGLTVTVRCGEVETIEYNRDKGLGVTVYMGTRRGHASTTDFSPQAVRETVEAALAIACHTASDDCAGLADADLLATEFPDLDLYHPWDLDVEQAIAIAKECEDAAFAADPIITNSEGGSVSFQEAQFVYANSLGFCAGYPSSRHSVSCAVIGGRDDAMQRDYWYTTARSAADLEPAAQVGRRAGERTARRVGARKIATMQVPVLYEAPVAASLLGHFVSAASGGSLYRKSSFLLDAMGTQVFAPWVTIRELPHVPRGLASSAFDEEGVSTRRRDLVSAGTLQGWFLGSYSARKLGLRSTGNAGGCHNLVLESTGQDFDTLLKQMGRGLLVTELMGHGVNNVTGDYSRGAAGFWVEDGRIAYPVEEVTVAGSLTDMYRGMVAAGTDVVVRGSRQCGSVLVDGMTIAGD